MRKGIFLSVLMIPLLLLGGCFGRDEAQKALDLAMTIRREYLALDTFSTKVQLTADYGHRVYDFEVDALAQPGELLLTVAAPELISGVTAKWLEKEGYLEYDGVCVETGPLNEDDLTPMSALPALLEAIRSGYITACCLEESGLLRVDYGSPDVPPGTGTEYILWFTADGHEPIRGEILQDRFRCINCTFSQFTKEGSP